MAPRAVEPDPSPSTASSSILWRWRRHEGHESSLVVECHEFGLRCHQDQIESINGHRLPVSNLGRIQTSASVQKSNFFSGEREWKDFLSVVAPRDGDSSTFLLRRDQAHALNQALERSLEITLRPQKKIRLSTRLSIRLALLSSLARLTFMLHRKVIPSSTATGTTCSSLPARR